jgi:predicted Fe-Mo cluster-binding NifX family protein
MRVAISAEDGRGLNSVVSPHFGRCPFFVLVDLEGQAVQQVQALPNPFYNQHQPGQVPEFIHTQQVDVMLTGGMGRRAIEFFRQYEIETATGAAGTVRLALEQYLGGQLQGAEPCLESRAHDCDEEEVPAAGEYEQDEVGRLREEVESLRRQMDDVTARLESLGDD